MYDCVTLSICVREYFDPLPAFVSGCQGEENLALFPDSVLQADKEMSIMVSVFLNFSFD